MAQKQKKLEICQFGNPILRQPAKNLTIKAIESKKTRKLIKQMQELVVSKKMGVGLAAPQVGESLSLAIVCVRPTKHRPKVENFDLTIINPEITKTYGRKIQMWEGCISGGPLKSGLFAKVPRYKKIDLKYQDEKGRPQQKTFEGLPAHVVQHEVDHLNGILFVDRIKDTTTFVTYSEYIKIAKKSK